MTTPDLHISTRLRNLLPPLTAEQRKQLEQNITTDGRVLDPILYWYDGKRNVVVDGMHRFEIIRGKNIQYRAEAIELGKTYEDAEKWIWDHQAGRRNLTREVIGRWYNQTKASHGGDRKIKRSNDPLVSTSGGSTAQKIAEKAGVSEATVRRDGARMEALEQCVPAVQKGINSGAFKATDADIKLLAKLPPADQQAVALVLRKGQAQTVKTAMKITKVKQPTTKDYGKCPVCAGVKWTAGEEGMVCKKCQHPHGEPAGDPEEERIKTQRQKTVKTLEAAMRAFDDLQCILARPAHDEAIKTCKRLLKIAREWK